MPSSVTVQDITATIWEVVQWLTSDLTVEYNRKCSYKEAGGESVVSWEGMCEAAS